MKTCKHCGSDVLLHIAPNERDPMAWLCRDCAQFYTPYEVADLDGNVDRQSLKRMLTGRCIAQSIEETAP